MDIITLGIKQNVTGKDCSKTKKAMGVYESVRKLVAFSI
jgi:hypothetical protein